MLLYKSQEFFYLFFSISSSLLLISLLIFLSFFFVIISKMMFFILRWLFQIIVFGRQVIGQRSTGHISRFTLAQILSQVLHSATGGSGMIKKWWFWTTSLKMILKSFSTLEGSWRNIEVALVSKPRRNKGNIIPGEDIANEILNERYRSRPPTWPMRQGWRRGLAMAIRGPFSRYEGLARPLSRMTGPRAQKDWQVHL